MVDKLTQDVVGNTLSDEDLRRSRRTANHNKGFKGSGCKDKNCIGCSVKPPFLSQSVIRNLGETFCKIESSKLSVAALNKKKKKTGAPLVEGSCPRKKLTRMKMVMSKRIRRKSRKSSRLGRVTRCFILLVRKKPFMLCFIVMDFCPSGSVFLFYLCTDAVHSVPWMLNFFYTF